MPINSTTLMLAALSGAMGTLIGGTQSFIIYGFVLIFQTIMASCGQTLPVFNLYVANLMFLPAVMFSAAVPAAGYASGRYDVREWEVDRSLAFTHDPMVMVTGALTGVCGYTIAAFVSNHGFPLDAGAFSVATVGTVSRIIFPKTRIINRDAVRVLRDKKMWMWDMLVAVVCASVTAFFVGQTGILTIGFMISAATILLQYFPKTQYFPTTHQITMPAAIAMAATGSIFWAVVVGMLGQVIFIIFGGFLNMGCGTHIDPPAVSIVICSLLVNLFL